MAIGSGYAAITTGRVLNAKHSTASRSHQQSSRQVWDRVAQAASSSSFASTSNGPTPRPPDRFPPLQAAAAALPPPINPTANHPPAFRQGPRNTPWSSSTSRAPSGPSPPISRPDSSSSRTRPGPPPPKLSNALFPELPTASSNKQRAPVSGNVSLRNILGNPAPPAAPAWQAGGSNGNSGNEGPESGSGNDPPKGKKGKGKGKQTLFTLGSFPT